MIQGVKWPQIDIDDLAFVPLQRPKKKKTSRFSFFRQLSICLGNLDTYCCSDIMFVKALDRSATVGASIK